MRFVNHLAIIYSDSRSKRNNAKKLTWRPITPSKSPTALTTISHISRKAVCKNCWIGTSWLCWFFTSNFGAKMSPAQKQVLINKMSWGGQGRKSKEWDTSWLKRPVFDIHWTTDSFRLQHILHLSALEATQHLYLQGREDQSPQPPMSRRALQSLRSNATRHRGAWKQRPSYHTVEVKREACVCSRGIQCHILHFEKPKTLRESVWVCERLEDTYGPPCSTASQATTNLTIHKVYINKILTRGKDQKDILNDKPHLRKRQRCSCASSSGNGRPTKVTDRWSPGQLSWSWLTGL